MFTFAIAFRFALFSSFFKLASAAAQSDPFTIPGGAVLNSPTNGTFDTNGVTITLPNNYTFPGSFIVYAGIDISATESSACPGSELAVGIVCTVNDSGAQTYTPFYRWSGGVGTIGGVEMNGGDTIRMAVAGPFEYQQTGSVYFSNQDNDQSNTSLVHVEQGFCGRSVGWMIDAASADIRFPSFGSISFTNAAAFGIVAHNPIQTYGPQNDASVSNLKYIDSNNDGITILTTSVGVDSITFTDQFGGS